MKISKKYLILFVLLLCGVGFANAHPYYVSLCQIDYNPETKALEISLKTFADDLLLALENEGHRDVFIGEEREDPETDDFIKDYLNSKLKFEVNGVPVSYQFIGKETEDAVVWSYLEISNVNELKTLDVTCSLLTEVLDTQNNIIQVEKNKEIKSLLLNKRKTKGTLSFTN